MEQEEFCPHCGESFRGPEIPEEYLRKGYYGEWDGKTKRYYFTKLGIEIQGEYDGVLIWRCEKCQHSWPRFSKDAWERLHNKAVTIIENWNKEKSNA